MLVVDIETSGGVSADKGIWQIGALELENPKNFFLEDARIDDSDLVEQGALLVTGKTEAELRDKSRQPQKELLRNFFEWAKKAGDRDFLSHNPQFDFTFLRIKAEKYGLKFPFGYRCFDLHTVACMRHFQINKEFSAGRKSGQSDMSFSKILAFCGIPDPRILLDGEKVIKEGTPHSGLEDARMEAECFSRLVYGKNLLEEYNQYPIPTYLKLGRP